MHLEETTIASCKATLAESTRAFARAHSPTDESDRLALRNQVVKSTDVEGSAPLAAAGAGEAGCCKTDSKDGDIFDATNAIFVLRT